jgi:esterase/lipase superfamily enzyme
MVRRALLPAILALAIVESGCAAYPYEAYPPRVRPALGRLCEGYAEVGLFYATDRRETDRPEPALHFSGQRSREIKYGRCCVSVPAGHGRGRTERPALLTPARPTHHVLLTELGEPLSKAAFFEQLAQALTHSAQRNVFVFVHGYAVTFEAAAQRAAQLAHDVDLDGAAIIYSWPAQGGFLSYLVDGDNAEWAAHYLKQFLMELVQRTPDARIHLMAHSLGCRVLTWALKSFVADQRTLHEPAFDQVILAAGDMDAEIFERDYAPYIVQATRRLTIYVSSADWALGGSQKLHGYMRLGQLGSAESQPAWPGKVDVVDATAHDKGPVGHVYYAESPTILSDVAGVLAGLTPAERGLQRDGAMWRVPANR